MLLMTLLLSMNENYKCRKCVLDIETTTFAPWENGKIICIGIKDVDSGEVLVFHDENEEAMIIRFFQYFKQINFQEIIDFNIGFDIRYILIRCLRYKIPANSFFAVDSTDLMAILHRFKRLYTFDRPGTLDEWCRCLFGKGKLLNNNSVPALYRQGRITEIIRYNKNDLELTHELWKRITFVLNGYNNGN